MPSYTEPFTGSQVPIDYDENLILTELCPVSEVLSLIARAPIEPDLLEAKWNTIDAYESGAIGAVEALRYLEAIGAFGDADDLMRAYCAGVRACLVLEGPPSPTLPPPAAPGARSAPSEYLLDVLSSAREGRAA